MKSRKLKIRKTISCLYDEKCFSCKFSYLKTYKLGQKKCFITLQLITYFVKWSSNGECRIFSSSRSFLFRNNATEEFLEKENNKYIYKIDTKKKKPVFDSLKKYGH